MEIDFVAEAFQVGEVFVPENENNEFDDEEVNSVESTLTRDWRQLLVASSQL